MKKADISWEQFSEKCLELWRSENCPLLPGMAELILEEYNNAAIDAFEEESKHEDD